MVPATMPVRGAAGKGEALRLLTAVSAVAAAVVVCLVYVGLPLLVSTESLVRSPLKAVTWPEVSYCWPVGESSGC